MICAIANLNVDVPEIGDLPTRCRDYRSEGTADIVIDGSMIRTDRWPDLSAADNIYLASGSQFYRQLLKFDGLMLHSSAVVYQGIAYLFSGPCGIGKSTHARIWQDTFGYENVAIINDDKPAIRIVDGKWYAFGTPWCGKDGINRNMYAPLGGICFLHRGDGGIKRLTPVAALPQLLKQSMGLGNEERTRLLIPLVDRLLADIPIYEFSNRADNGDARITYEAMKTAQIGEKHETER